jgi:putative hemolysin
MAALWALDALEISPPPRGLFLVSTHKENTMKDIPVPTLALSPTGLPRGSLHPSFTQNPTKLEHAPAAKPFQLQVIWAQHLDQVRQAQKLRHDIFAGEMGASLATPIAGHDIDRFDDFCEHLLVVDQSTAQVVGTYRLLTPAQALRAGGLYTETEFDISSLHGMRSQLVELGRSCVHADYRGGAVIMALWGALMQFMVRNKLDSMIGCASIPLLHNGRVGGDVASSIWAQVSQSQGVDPAFAVWAHTPLPVDQFDQTLEVEPPALIKGYLRLGARVLGAPAWDPDFNTADLPMMMRTQDIPARYRRHFLGH